MSGIDGLKLDLSIGVREVIEDQFLGEELIAEWKEMLRNSVGGGV